MRWNRFGLATAVLTIAVFAIDLAFPHGYGVWAGYVVPLILARHWDGFRAIVTTSSAAIVLMVLDLAFGRPGDPVAGIVNLLEGTLLIVITATLLAWQFRTDERLRYQLSAPRRAEENFRRLLESAPDAMVIVDPTGRIVLVNAQTERMFGHAREAMLGQTVEFLIPQRLRGHHAGHRGAYFSSPRVRPMGEKLELRGLRADGSEFPVEISLSPLETDEGMVVSSVIRDVTNRAREEQLVRDSLREKETMLKEIHHRVKNNLAVVSSLFYLQSVHANDAGTIQILQESQDRIRSMALVHETLYRSDTLAAVDFAEYATSVSMQLMRSYGASDGRVRLRTDLETSPMSIEVAVPCGLVLNELVTNALKHAFPGERSGEVVVSLQREGSATYCLRVADDGVGLPPGTAVEEGTTLGMRLVRSLARQIDANLEVLDARPGTDIRLTFQIS